MSPLFLAWDDLRFHPYGCSVAPCEERAEGLLDGEPVCLDCAELVIARVSLPRPFVKLLPDLVDRVPGL